MEKNIINTITEWATSEMKHYDVCYDKLLNAIDDVDKYYSGNSAKNMKKKLHDLAIKYDNAKGNVIANKQSLLNTIAYIPLMGSNKDEVSHFMRQLCLDFIKSMINQTEKLLKEYGKLSEEFGNAMKSKQLKGRKTTITKKPIVHKLTVRKTVRKPATRKTKRA